MNELLLIRQQLLKHRHSLKSISNSELIEFGAGGKYTSLVKGIRIKCLLDDEICAIERELTDYGITDFKEENDGV